MLQEDFTITFWNRRLEDWTGIPCNTIIGARIFDLFPHFDNPEYSKRIENIFAGEAPAVFSSELHEYIIPIPEPNNGHRIQHTTAIKVKTDDGTIHVMFAIQDVTELNYHISRYKALRDHTLAEIEERKRIESELRKAKELAEDFNKTLSLLLTTDWLTQISNRRYFDERFENEWRRAIRGKYPISLIFSDLDFFKEYNDSLGHPAGDECLKKVAGVMKSLVRRPADLAARLGGEEFVIMLPMTSLEDSVHIAEKVREKIENLKIIHADSRVAGYVTASFGVASATPKHELNHMTLIKAADEALYKAKNNGRNRVEVSEQSQD